MIDGGGRVPETLSYAPSSDYPIGRTITVIGDDIPDEITVGYGDEEISRFNDI